METIYKKNSFMFKVFEKQKYLAFFKTLIEVPIEL